MFNTLLPQRLDNSYCGSRLGLWLFVLVLFMKGAIGLNSIFNGRSVASSADGIPVDTFTPAAAQSVVSLFALLGLSQFVIALFGTLVLLRYRAMIPLMFGLLLLEHVSERLILQVMPIVTTGTPPGVYVNLVLFALLIVGLGLSLWNRGNLPVQHDLRAMT